MRRLRTEKTGIVFDSTARGWAFDVTEHFRPSLDIAYTRRLDKEKDAERRRQLGRELKESEKIYKCVWTRGEPAAYSFLEGQIFYDPPGIRSMIWEDALKRLARMVQIKEATPDPGALVESFVIDEENELRAPTADTSDPGRVVFEIHYYDGGECRWSERMELSQLGFAQFLKSGLYPRTGRRGR